MKTTYNYFKGRLARRMSAYVIMASTLIAIFTSSIQIYSEYHREITELNAGLEQIEQTHLSNIASRVWVLDTTELKTTLDGLLSLPSIQYIAVYENDELLMTVGADTNHNVVTRHYPLIYRFNTKNNNIGELIVKASLDKVYQHIIDRTVIILGSNAIKTFIVAALILFIFYRLVARHLYKLAEFAKQLSIHTLDKTFEFDRKKNPHSRQDELDFLSTALSNMQQNLAVATKELQKKELDLKITLNSIGDAVITTDAKGHVTRMNPMAEQLTGWSLQEAQTHPLKTIFTIINASTRESIENPVEKVIACGETVQLSNHTTLIAKDGTEYQISDSAAPIRNEDNHILGMVLVFNDITTQYHLREAATKSRRDMQAIMDNTPAVIYSKDTDGHYIFINQQFRNLFKVRDEDIIGKTDYDFFAKKFAYEFQYNDKSVLEKGHALESEETVPHDDGPHIYASTKFPLFNEEGKIYAVCGISTDITERNKMEHTLLENAERFNRWKESNFIGILHSKANGEIIDANNTLLNMLGYSQQDIKDGILDWRKFTPSEFFYLDKKAIEETNEKGYWAPFEKEYLHKDGSRVPVLIGGSVFHEDRDEFIVFIVDLTERKLHEEQLRRSQKMEALGKLTGGIAHDYNNMLGVILGYSDLLERRLTDQPKLAGYANKIHHAGERGANLTKKLLSFSRQEAPEAAKLNLNTLLLGQQDMLQKTLTVRIKLVIDLADKVWPICLDSNDLEDAILNICINAMHAMTDNKLGAQLTIRTNNQSLTKLEALSLGIKAGDYVQLSLTDTGSGMDESTKEKIFDPFFTTKGSKGTGLGLSQVFGFIKRTEGGIKVYSEPGNGSQFVLYFPRYDDGYIDEIIETTGDFTALDGKENILIIDDEADLCELATEQLRLEGYQVFSAENANQALIILEHESIDLILSDVIMPGMNGYQLASMVQEKYPAIKIQLASGFSDNQHLDMVDENLHQNLLNKPYTSQTLLKRIRFLLDD